MKKTFIALWGGMLLAAGAAGHVLADHHAVKISMKDGIGHYLTDAHGRTLYWFKLDSMNQSACNDGCLEKWPVYYRDKPAPPMKVDPKDFGTLSRADGKQQSTFRGYPLYYFFKDSKPGDTFGEGVKKVWYVIDPGNFPPKE